MNKDMSKTCNMAYQEKWLEANVYGTLSQDEWYKWYNEHCGKCRWMNEVCMYGEDYQKEE